MLLDSLGEAKKIAHLIHLQEMRGYLELAEIAEECENYDNVQKMLNISLDILDRHDIPNKTQISAAIYKAKDNVFNKQNEI